MSRHELFIYWRCDRADAAAALAATAQMQAALLAQHAVLRARLYQRVEADVAQVTVMESYSAAAGIDASLQAAVEAAAVKALARWQQGQRHLERFEELPSDRG